MRPESAVEVQNAGSAKINRDLEPSWSPDGTVKNLIIIIPVAHSCFHDSFRENSYASN